MCGELPASDSDTRVELSSFCSGLCLVLRFFQNMESNVCQLWSRNHECFR